MKKSLLTFVFACAVFTLSLAVRGQAQTVTFLANFDGNNGFNPFGSVSQATDGNFYGTTTNGGRHGYGNVYRITPSGDVTLIYDFCQRPNCSDGETPEAAPVLGRDGYLYGTTTNINGDVHGTIYKMTLGGQLTTLYTFCSLANCADGSIPNALMQASDGNFYGTTFEGGTSGNGTIFRISTKGEFTSLYSFCSLANCADGHSPIDPPIQGIDGNLYGAAWQSPTGGVLYKFTLAGNYKVLYSFCRSIFCTAGSGPHAITQDADGNFFGTTQYGGTSGYGTVFELTSKQQFIDLHDFNKADGAYPNAGLTLASDGNFYGITAEGGHAGVGTIFEITAAGKYRPLYEFAPPNGNEPAFSLIQGTDGNFYGGIPGGPGNAPYGAVFEFSNGLGPLVETAPGGGKVGQSVLILGNGLTGTSSVSFNGVAASFTVESDTYIKATVPTGATTGKVSVVTPAGTLNSNPQFVVTK